MVQAGEEPEADVTLDKSYRTAQRHSHWKNALVVRGAPPPALDHSLAFHRLQEARQELYQAHFELATLAPRQRAKLLEYYETRLLNAEQWLARTLQPRVE